MRYTVVKIDYASSYDGWRYNSESDSSDFVEDLFKKESYYPWVRGKDFAFFEDTSIHTDDEGNSFRMDVIVFYETHPFFNCMVLAEDFLVEDEFGGRRFEPMSVVEKFIKKEIRNARRRENRKLKKGAK